MTPAERADVSILNGSRRARIARGAGVTVRQVNDLVTRFVAARKMMQSFGSGLMGGAHGKQQPKKKAKKGGGNPAKKAAQARAKQQAAYGRAIEQAEQLEATGTSAFGFDPAEAADALSKPGAAFELPPQVRQMFEQANRGPSAH
jgi:signal recognition particle subunit SRP54